jgi:putative methionine-R-sulfoxide reductase with GAF domain
VSSHSGALEAIDRILNRGGDADDVLRQVVSVLHERLRGSRWVAISFVEGGELVLGPELGERGGVETSVPISYQGAVVAELSVAAEDLDAEDRALLERVALLISPHCLVGWDTGGEAWSP